MRGIVGIVLAMLGFGAWSLVLGILAGGLAFAVGAVACWCPGARASAPQRSHAKELRFGGTLTGVNVLTACTTSADSIFIGRVLGAGDLGLYSLGFRLPELLIVNLSVVAAAGAVPRLHDR